MRSVLAIVLLMSVLGCAEHIGRAELLSEIRAGSPPTIVDVRSRREFEESHVPGAVHIPFYAILGGVDLPEGSGADESIVVYCEHGPRAASREPSSGSSATDRFDSSMAT